VNLIGEHTDYNEGFVLPAAVDLDVWLAFQPLDEPRVEVTSLDLDEQAAFQLDELTPCGGWVDHVAGVAWAALEAGIPIRGFRGVLDSTIPMGAGLGSSAALEMAVALALLDPSARRPSDGALAALGLRAENGFVGVGSGIMDEFASVAGQAGHAILLDCRSLGVALYPIPADLVILICDTGTRRTLVGSAFDERRADCAEGARLIGEFEPDIRSLRDVTEAMLEAHRDRLPERVWRRCRHVVRENLLTGAAAAALALDRRDTVADIFAESHASLRDLFDVVTPELDRAVAIAASTPGVVGARMTGAGFGGCTVNLVERKAVDGVRDRLLDGLTAHGLTPSVYVTEAVDGAGFVVP
jgi:galactokinase